MQPRSGLGCSISVISLQKLKTFLEQPKYNHHPRFPCPPPPAPLQHHVMPYQQQQQQHGRWYVDEVVPQKWCPTSEPSENSALDPRSLEDLSGNVDTTQLPPNLFNNANNHDSNSGNRVVNNGGPPPMGQPGPPQGVANSGKNKGAMMGPMGGPPQPHEQSMSLAPPTKMSPSPHPQDINPSANGSAGRKYQCKMCPQIFGSKADLQLHTQMHMRDAKPYKCTQCSKSFANSSYLSQHTRIHLGIKPYRCEICHRKFTQLSHLQQHIRTHTGDKPYKCRYPNCNKAFSQLSNLQSHSRCHQTDKPFKCNSCYKCFSDETSLLEHIPKHKESKHLKTHICQFCGKSYTQETYLAKHMQKHADKLEKHGMMNSLVIPPSMAPGGSMHHLQPDVLWQKAIQARVAENVSMVDDGGPNSSVAAMAAVVATQRRGMENNMPNLNAQENRMNMCNENTNNAVNNNSNNMVNMFDMPMPSVNNNISTSTNNAKSTSAFTPIQTGILPMVSGNQLNIPTSSPRTYFGYDSINFTNKNTNNEMKGPSFPNQLISLKQIRSYAGMAPSITGMDHPISLKNKGPN